MQDNQLLRRHIHHKDWPRVTKLLTLSTSDALYFFTSIHPTQGLKSTLPQHRLSYSHKTLSPTPLQDEYPVWYFFYCTLADSSILTRLLSLSEAETPIFVAATISRGIVKKWQHNYNALIDGG